MFPGDLGYQDKVIEAKIIQRLDNIKEEKPEPKIVTEVSATIYNPTRGQCGPQPLITADGSKIDLQKLEKRELKWIAISPDLKKVYPLGTKVRLECDICCGSHKVKHFSGIYEIHDLMSPRWKKKIDLLVHPKHNPDYPHGNYYRIRMEKLEKEEDA